MAAPQDLATIQAFMSSLRKQSPPYSCYICQKLYRSYSGLEYHLKEVGHDENGKERSKHVNSRPMNNTPKKVLVASRMKSRKSGGLKSSNASSPAPGKKETLTYSEAQRLVQVDVDGALCRIDMSHGLGVLVDNEPNECVTNTADPSEEDGDVGVSTDKNLNDNSIASSPNPATEEEKTDSAPLQAECVENLDVNVDDSLGSVEPCRKVLRRSCVKAKSNGGSDISKSTPDVKKKPRRTASSGACTSALPVAVVRMIEPPCTNTSLSDQSPYFRFIERSCEELDETVEYDMDEDDNEWLESVNAKRKTASIEPVTRSTFEILMDRLEKESFFESRREGTNGLDPSLDDDAVCCICNDGEVQNSNAILFCDMCNLAVHQECYGVPFIPEGQWLCRRCLNSPSCAVDCVLCPNKGGAFKQTDKGQWAHVVCALWIPEVQFANAVFLEPIDSINEIPGARWRLTCYICHRRGGACIQCVNRNCYTAFHPTCAQHAGLHMNMEMIKKTEGDKLVPSIRKLVYCDVHSPKSGEEPSDPDDSVCGLTVGKAVVGKSTPRAPPSDLLKKKLQAERRLSALSAAPIVNIPFVPDNKLVEIADRVNVAKKAEFLQHLRSFWALKRQSRSGVPLLRRLQASHQSQKNGLETATVSALKEQLVHWHRLRHDLERSRLLIELIRKREKLKREDLRMHQHMTDLKLQPLTVLLRRTLEQLVQKDPAGIFAHPVSVGDVPDYLDIISIPMDFSTMRQKLEGHEYTSVISFAEDFQLVYRNCMTYNAKDTVYYRAAVRLRDSGTPILRFARKQVDRAGIDPNTGMHIDQDVDPVEFERRLAEDLPLAEQLEDLKEELEEIKSSSTPGKASRIRSLRKQITILRKQLPKEPKIESDVASAEALEADAPAAHQSPSKPVPQKRRRGVGRGQKRLRLANRSLAMADAAAASSSDSCSEGEETKPNVSALTGDPSSLMPDSKTPDSTEQNGLYLDSASRPHRNRRPSERMRETDDFLLRCAAVTRTSSHEVHPDLPVSPTSLSPTGVTPTSLGDTTLPGCLVTADIQTSNSRASRPVLSLPRIRRSPSNPSPMDVASAENVFSTSSPAASTENAQMDMDSGGNAASLPSRRRGSVNSSGDDAADACDVVVDSPASRRKRRQERHSLTVPSREMFSAMPDYGSGDIKPVLKLNGADTARRSLSDSMSEDTSTNVSEEGSAPPVLGKVMDYSTLNQSMLHVQLKPLDLVWAKCRGYPSYPALMIDPAMTVEEADVGGTFLPLPPQTVLDLQQSQEENLVLFFDARRTWQWLQRDKLAPLGHDTVFDELKLSESRKLQTRKSVNKAFDRALMHRLRASNGISPAGHADEDLDS